MAFYDYKCIDCGKIFEIEKGMNEHVSPKCPHCKSAKTERKFTMFRRGASKGDEFARSGSKHSGSCSSCSSGVCSSCSH